MTAIKQQKQKASVIEAIDGARNLPSIEQMMRMAVNVVADQLKRCHTAAEADPDMSEDECSHVWYVVSMMKRHIEAIEQALPMPSDDFDRLWMMGASTLEMTIKAMQARDTTLFRTMEGVRQMMYSMYEAIEHLNHGAANDHQQKAAA